MPRIWKPGDFGLEVRTFCAQTGYTLREISEACGVKYGTLRCAINDRTAGHEVKPKVRQFMRTQAKAAWMGNQRQ